jgi:hypothetical protein
MAVNNEITGLEKLIWTDLAENYFMSDIERICYEITQCVKTRELDPENEMKYLLKTQNDKSELEVRKYVKQLFADRKIRMNKQIDKLIEDLRSWL